MSAEAFPLAKTGGLGDAVSGLAHALSTEGLGVTLLLPAYPGTVSRLRAPRELAVLDGLPGGRASLIGGHCLEIDLPVLLLQNDALYNRTGLYLSPEGDVYGDNHVRFAALSHAAARIAGGIDGIARPHIVHAHDWHAALAPLLIRQQGLDDVKTVLTLHNLAFQGNFPLGSLQDLCMGDEPAACSALELYDQINFLSAGIRCADLITVVSHNYAREILTPEFGCGLQDLLRSRRDDIVSIPNGIDTTEWDPQADRYLRGHPFNAFQLGNKAVCKYELQRAFGLQARADATLMVMCSRLTTQKMADLAAEAIPQALEAHPELQVCVMGQGDKGLEHALRTMAQAYPGRCAVWIGFDEARSHLLHAGADILLHGSRFEPFGLTPLYSMRYGTIPIGSRVGGMVDTILDPGPGVPPGAMRTATGVLFRGETAQDMVRAVARAMSLHRLPDVWRAMQVNGMRADFSWRTASPAYMAAYQSLRPDVIMGRIPEKQRRTLFGPRILQPGRTLAGPAGANATLGVANAMTRRRSSQDSGTIGGREISAV
ncbi:glycogen synthase GlgA [Allopusillimonas ginsengisoli]|nr:glycogen synthase GlgA [Allopusillimonas ginsengisoli]